MTQPDHELKTWPSYFSACWSGRKAFEVRRDDRGYQLGDRLLLREWRPVTRLYTGRALLVEVVYLLAGGAFGVEEGYCVLGFRVVNRTVNLRLWEAEISRVKAGVA